MVQGVRSLLAEHALGDRHTGAIDRAAQCAEGPLRGLHGAPDALPVGHIGRDKARAGAALRCHALTGLLVEIGDDDGGAGGRKLACAGRAQTRGAAADQKHAVFQTHQHILSSPVTRTDLIV